MKHFSQKIILLFGILFLSMIFSACKNELPKEFLDPPNEFSLMPFWFWNDTLKHEEISRQLDDFQKHHVNGFVIHPRIGLPWKTSWLSDSMIDAMRFAIEEATRRGMYVILYDEGMYPSGSSAGQVVARNQEYAARGLIKIDLAENEEPKLTEEMRLITVIDRPNGERVAIVEKPSGGFIRGLHYLDEKTPSLPKHQREYLPPASDILNPEVVKVFMELVYERFAKEFGDYFGTTIMGIFTDEPSILGKGDMRAFFPGSTRTLIQVNEILGYDFTSYLANLWYEDHPDYLTYRADYKWAINLCLEENYYRPISEWCERHGIALMGHPYGSMDIGALRFFQIPGQDIVWRYIEPGPTALEGQHSTMAKGASSAMIHLERRRNSNELYGAYGHELTYEEMLWLANWCFVRGQNFLFPHAFYYSVRGLRFDERPPDVGPNAAWWGQPYIEYADACRRLSWINTDSYHICDIAILAEPSYLPDQSAKVCFQYQRDFNYLEIRHLWEDAITKQDGIHIAGMHYKVLIVDSLSPIPPKAYPMLQKLADHNRLLVWNNPQVAERFNGAIQAGTPLELIRQIDMLIAPDLVLDPPSKSIRYRHVVKDGVHYYILFNEEDVGISVIPEVLAKGNGLWVDPYTATTSTFDRGEVVAFDPYEIKVLMIRGN